MVDQPVCNIVDLMETEYPRVIIKDNVSSITYVGAVEKMCKHFGFNDSNFSKGRENLKGFTYLGHVNEDFLKSGKRDLGVYNYQHLEDGYINLDGI